MNEELTPNVPEEETPNAEVVAPTEAAPVTENETAATIEVAEEQMVTATAPVAVELEEEVSDILDTHEDDAEDASAFIEEHADLNEFTKKDLVELAEKLADAIKKHDKTATDVKNIDTVSKQIHPIYDDLKIKEKSEALKQYIAENGSDEGFEFQNDSYTIRFESLMIQIRDEKNKFFRNQKQLREDYFDTKTELLKRLREIVEDEEKGGSKENWNQFKKVQDDWKEAGNINSPHNGSLWSAYNALVDRYFDIRSIQNELKELDRKRNLESKSEIVTKIESLSKQFNEGYSKVLFNQANELLEEYKQIGPAPREEQEALWERLKAAFDAIYDKKREQQESSKALQQEVLDAKTKLVENLQPYLSFKSKSINEWNEKTKEILSIQDQWNALSGSMPREKGKEVSKDFWGMLKTFFKNKSQFFAELEAEREENLKAKTALCEKIEAILSNGDTSASNTDSVIEMQKTWRTIGHVPEKFKDSIYDRFKKAADAYFDLKRTSSSEIEKEYQANLQAKVALCEKIEAFVASNDIDLSQLQNFKKEFNQIGFVPKKDIKTIQKRFVDAINAFVKASSVSKAEEEKLLIRNEVDVVLKTGGDNRSLNKQENELRKKIKTLEDDIAVWKNNILFFGHSKGAEKLKAEYDKKIAKAEEELKAMNDKLKLFSAANNS